MSDFTDFYYSLDSSNFITFSAAKTENINDGNILYIDAQLFVDSESDPITFGGDTIYFEDGSILVGDIFSSQPVQVSTSQIPEGNNVFALSLLGFFALFQKTLKFSSRSQK